MTDHCGNRTALHYAALKGHHQCIATLLDACPPATLERIQPNGSIVKCARNARAGTARVAPLLALDAAHPGGQLRWNCHPGCSDQRAAFLERPASSAARGCRVCVCARRLVNIPTVSGFTPLHYGVYNRSIPVLQALMQRGANIVAAATADGVYDVVIGPRWTTPMHIAAMIGERAGVGPFARGALWSASRHTWWVPWPWPLGDKRWDARPAASCRGH